MIEFNDKERKSLGGMFDAPSDKSGGAFGRSKDVGVGVSGLESAYSDKKENEKAKVSDRGDQIFSTIISDSEDNAFEPLIDRMVNSVFTVNVANAKEDFIVPLGNVLTTLKEYEEEQRFAQQFVYQGMFMRVIQLLTKLQESTSFFLRPQTFFGNILEKVFVSRRREQTSVVNAIQEQTQFMRTGRLDRERGFFERIFEPQAIGRAFLSMATGFGIGRDKAELADEKKSRGEQLGLLERMSARLYQDITFKDQQEIRAQSRDEKIIDTLNEQTESFSKSLKLHIGNATRGLSKTLNNLGKDITNSFRLGFLGLYTEMIDDRSTDKLSAPGGNFKRNFGVDRLDEVFNSDREKQEKEDREKTVLEIMKEQYVVLQEELPKLTNQMRFLIGTAKGAGDKGLFAGVAGAVTGLLFGRGKNAAAAAGARGIFGRMFAPIIGLFGRGAKDIGKTLKGAGKRLKAPGPIGALLAAAGLIGATQNNAQENLQLGGAFGGAIAGGKLGALGGSVLGPVGTIIGGVIGSTVGFVAGEQFGEFLGGLFKRKEKTAGEKADGIIDGIYRTLDEDIDDQSKTGAGRFVRKVFAVGSSVMSDIWSKSKEIASPYLSAAWEITKDSSSTAWEWIKDTTKTFATGGAVTIANLIADSIGDVAPIIGSTIFKGIKWSIFEGLPALGSLFWEYSKWSINTLLPAIFGIGKDLIKGLFDFGVTILGRSLSWLGQQASSVFGWLGDRLVDMGIVEERNPILGDNPTFGSMNRNDTDYNNAMRDSGYIYTPDREVERWMNDNPEFRSNGVTNRNEVGSSDYTNQMVNWKESEHYQKVEESESELNTLLKGSVEIEGTIASTLSKANELQQEAIRATRDLARAVQQQQQIPVGIAKPEIDPSTLWTTLGFNE